MHHGDTEDTEKIQEILEDLADLQCMEERKNDTRRDLESVLAELKDAGRI